MADPNGSDLNQAYLKYNFTPGTSVAFGRQRINHNDQRFVGGVAWRQNEQTFDGVRLQSKLGGGVALDYSFSHNVNRLVGERNPAGDLDVDLHMLNLTFAPGEAHKFAAFGYSMDFEDAVALSNQTLGLDYRFNSKYAGVHLAYASQSDTGDSPLDYTADYTNIELVGKVAGVALTLGQEVLGSDNGVGFSTPLATLHKFNGFADKFLGTPGDGLNDRYLKLGFKAGKFNFGAALHQFEAEESDREFGDEVNAMVGFSPAKHWKLLLKYASYDSEDFATDTDKVWFQVLLKY